MNDAKSSSKTLIEKLGYKPLESVYLFGAPEDFVAYLEENEVFDTTKLPCEWAHGFFNHSSEMQIFLDNIALEDITKGLWVSWPKKSSGFVTDLTEQTFRDAVLPLGWVDIKVIAIDETWSGLKFTRRKN
jgi:hypothetical protein